MIVNKYFIYTYVKFLLTKHACDKRLCNIVPCIGKNCDVFFVEEDARQCKSIHHLWAFRGYRYSRVQRIQITGFERSTFWFIQK